MKELPVDSIVSILSPACKNLAGIYLYGSGARRELKSDSDIDLAVLADECHFAENKFDLAGKIASQVKRDVDLVDLRAAPTVLQFQIVSQGDRIYCQDPLICDRFEDYVYAAYARFNEERSGILKDIRDRGTVF